MLEVTVLGGFKMQDVERNIVARFPQKSKCFLAYILINRENAIRKEKLMEAFWGDRDKGNPESALRTMICRVRRELVQIFGEKTYILEKNGSYQWNQDIPLKIDMEDFFHGADELARKKLSVEEKILEYQRLFQLYQGNFMSSNNDYTWMEATDIYCESKFAEVTAHLVGLLIEEERYDEVERVCSLATLKGCKDEDLYYYNIKSKVVQGKYQEAVESYYKAYQLFENELGVGCPEKISSLYESIVKMYQSNDSISVEELRDEINEEEPRGAYVCDYPVFREIYKLEMRRTMRDKILAQNPISMRFLIMIEVVLKDQEIINHKEVMTLIEKIIEMNFRMGDVVTRYSATQYAVMLIGCTEEGCRLATGRMKRNILQRCKNIKLKIDFRQM